MSLTASSSSGAAAAAFTAVASTSASSAQSGINVDEELAAALVEYNDDQHALVTETAQKPPTLTEQLEDIWDIDPERESSAEASGSRRRKKIPRGADLESPS